MQLVVCENVSPLHDDLVAGKLVAGAWTGFTSGNARLGARQFASLRTSHESAVHHTPARTTTSPRSLSPPSPILARRTEQQHRSERALLEPRPRSVQKPDRQTILICGRPFCGKLDRRTCDCAGTHSTQQRQALSKHRDSPCQPIAHVTTLQSRASRREIRLQGRKQTARGQRAGEGAVEARAWGATIKER
jgi:hypothetical protein